MWFVNSNIYRIQNETWNVEYVIMDKTDLMLTVRDIQITPYYGKMERR